MASGLLIDYLGHGNIADRPATPNLYVGSIGLWWSDDTDELSLWDGSAWNDDIGGGGAGSVTSVGYSLDAAVADILSASGSPITSSGTIAVSAVDPGADRLIFWDDSAGKLTYLALGTGLSITGTTLNASGGGGSGAMSLVASQTVSGGAVSSITFSSLDLATDGRYQLEFSILNASGSATTLSMYYNSDTTASNYRNQLTTSAGAALTGSFNNSGKLFDIVGSSYATGVIDIFKDVLGRPRANSWCARDEPSALVGQDAKHIWTSTANVTGITLSASVSSSIGNGSKFKLYKIS